MNCYTTCTSISLLMQSRLWQNLDTLYWTKATRKLNLVSVWFNDWKF